MKKKSIFKLNSINFSNGDNNADDDNDNGNNDDNDNGNNDDNNSSSNIRVVLTIEVEPRRVENF